jgi:hypothetical protein
MFHPIPAAYSGASGASAQYAGGFGSVAVGPLEFADVTTHRTGEHAALVAEEFAFEKGFRNGGETDDDKGAVFAVTRIANGLGDGVFAGAAFTAEQDVGIAWGGGFEHAEEITHRPAAADDFIEGCLDAQAVV